MTVTLAQPLPTLIARGDLRHITQPQPATDIVLDRRTPIRAAAKPPTDRTVAGWHVTSSAPRTASMSRAGEHVSLPLGVIVAEAEIVASFPIRELAGCVDPPYVRWLAVRSDGRLFWQECDGHGLTTSPAPADLALLDDVAPGRHLWILASCQPTPTEANPCCND